MDAFPRRLHLHLPSGKDKYQTCWGLFFTIVLVILLCAYIGFAAIQAIRFFDDTTSGTDSFSDLFAAPTLSHVQYFEHTFPGQIPTNEVFPETEKSEMFQLAFGLV